MDLSVIIPCYNSGKYLQDALDSVAGADNAGKYKLEVIIVDDGSTDPLTKDLLAACANRYTVIYKENGGPASARNAGIRQASGEFLLFLDSDNRIRKQLIDASIPVLRSREADIVYGKPVFFGDTTEPRFITGPFDINRVIISNYIDMCCMMRREVWAGIGGFDEDRSILGMEDWDFFIRAHAADYRFRYIDEELYDYRILGGSLSQKEAGVVRSMRNAIYRKNIEVVADVLHWYIDEHRIYGNDKKRPFRSFIKFFYNKYLRSGSNRENAGIS